MLPLHNNSVHAPTALLWKYEHIFFYELILIEITPNYFGFTMLTHKHFEMHRYILNNVTTADLGGVSKTLMSS